MLYLKMHSFSPIFTHYSCFSDVFGIPKMETFANKVDCILLGFAVVWICFGGRLDDWSIQDPENVAMFLLEHAVWIGLVWQTFNCVYEAQLSNHVVVIFAVTSHPNIFYLIHNLLWAVKSQQLDLTLLHLLTVPCVWVTAVRAALLPVALTSP